MTLSPDQWTYRLCGGEFGPVSFELLARLAEGGQLGPDDLVCSPNGRWQPAGDIVGLIPETNDESPKTILPSIAAENPRARVVTPRDTAQRSTLGPSREQTIGPQSLTGASKPSASGGSPQTTASKPISMKDAVSSVLASAAPVAEHEKGGVPAVAPQRQAVSKPNPSQTAAPKPIEETSPHTRPTTSAAASTSTRAKVGAIDSTEQVSRPEPALVQPAPQRPVIIPQSKTSRFDPDVLKKIGVAVGACLTLSIVVVLGKPLLAGNGSKAHVIETQWTQTEKLITALLESVESHDESAMRDFRRRFAPRSREIVNSLTSAQNNGGNYDPVLTSAILVLHQEAIPNYLADNGKNPEVKAALDSAIQEARLAAEG